MHTRPITQQLPSPAAGTDIAFVPTQTDQCIVMAFTARLTTSAAVASRLPALVMKDQNLLQYVVADFGEAQTAGLAVTYTWARDFGVGISAAPVAGQSVSGRLPDAWLQPQDTIGTHTTNIDVADQWDQVVVRYYTGEHWLRLKRELAERTQIETAIATLGG